MAPIDVVDLPIGSHVGRADPLSGAAERGAEVIQVNLSAPRNWAAPVVRGDEDTLAAADIPIYVHAPYLVNPASADPAVRSRSRECIVAEAAAAARIGACGLVVHGGQAGVGSDAAEGIARWAEVLDGLNLPCRLLVENSAGGSSAVARDVRHWARLVGELRAAGHDVGVVLDTCHAHAAGLYLDDVVADLFAAVGSIDLVHANDSRDEPGSGRDRHEHLGDGHVPPHLLVAMVADAGAPVVVETPGPASAQAADIVWLRRKLAGHAQRRSIDVKPH